MKRLRVCIYGGTDLPKASEELISALAYRILDSMPAVVVTGGFLHSNASPQAISTDAAALEGCRRFAKQRVVDLKTCYEAWIPEPTLDSRPDVGGVLRMSEADGITVRVMTGRTPLGRRLAMVAGVDMLVTISGRRHTEVVVEQALEVGLPVLPIPNAGGDSQDLLLKYQQRIAASFSPGALDQCLHTLSTEAEPEISAEAIVELMRTAKVGRCLVLLPYDAEHDLLYTSLVEPAVAQQMIPVRLDRLPKSEAIYNSFAEAIQTSTAVIADITHLNENVMYEVGYAHGRGLTPLIYTREAVRLDQLPVYFRTLNVRLVSPEAPLDVLISEYLHSFKAGRESAWHFYQTAK
jgi:hypothetical protein